MPEDLGLSEKQAAVYLAALELGPSAVQDITKRAGINRVTGRDSEVHRTVEAEELVFFASTRVWPCCTHGLIFEIVNKKVRGFFVRKHSCDSS